MREASNDRVQLISDPSVFRTLRDQWNALVEAADGAIFCRHEWFDAAWQWRSRDARLYLLCLFADHRLSAILPLVLNRARIHGIATRELGFLTVPDTQVCDVIVTDRYRVAASTALAAELRNRQSEWDVIRLNYLAPGSVAASTFREALGGLTTRSIAAPGNPFIALDTNWEAYYATRSRRLKKANNLAANRLAKAGTVRIDWLQPDADSAPKLDAFVDRVIRISARSWKTRTGNSLDNPGPGAFIRRLSELSSRCGWLSIWILSVDDRPVAMEYQLVAKGKVYGLRSDFDAEFDAFSPGTCLNRHLTERLFGRGLHRYYMGPGNNAYKRRWAEHVEPIEELTIYGRSLRARCLARWEITVKPLGIKLRHRLRGAATEALEQERD